MLHFENCRILGYHSSDYEEFYLLEHNATSTDALEEQITSIFRVGE
jgi:hypothetical protein